MSGYSSPGRAASFSPDFPRAKHMELQQQQNSDLILEMEAMMSKLFQVSVPILLEAALRPLREDVRQLSEKVYQLEGRLGDSRSRPEVPEVVQELPSPAVVATQDFLAYVAPKLDGRSHKGQCGRIGVLGGSVDYAGAPFYAGMSALRSGAELLYLYTAEEAAPVIKSFSPELMVTPAYRFESMATPDLQEAETQALVDKIVNLLPRLHSLCIGPGLGSHEGVLAGVEKVIEMARQ
ncbi:unnamed protein product, partial [Polarella glacialis]